MPEKNKPMKFLKKFFGLIIKTINAIALITLLLAAYSDYISPLRSALFPYFGLFFPFIFAANLIVFFVWLFIRRWKMALLSAIVFLACFGSIHTYFPIHKKTGTIPEDCIKILTYNVMRFDGLKSDSKHANKIIQYIQDNDADVVCIQEYGSSKSNGKHLTENDIMKAMAKYPYHHIEELNYPYASEKFGLALFSKFPILSTKPTPYQSKYNGSFVAELDIRGKKVTLINNHLESNKLSKEERNDYYQIAQAQDIGARSLDVFTQMMAKRLTPAYKIRAKQAQIISEIVQKNKNPYTIVCGDFNDTPISYARHKIKGNLHDAFVDSGCGLGITYNKYRFLFRIDYILHSDNIESYNCTVGSLRDSDHYPVCCYLKLK
jgi:endonuclease/exonuclease/phosphatase family metal-dependent hydrolase